MKRRRYLSGTVTGTLVAVAGCVTGNDGGSGADSEIGNGGDEDGVERSEDGDDGGSTGPGTGGGEDDDDTGDEDGEDDGPDEPVPTEFASIRTVDDRRDPGHWREQAARSFRSDPFALGDGLTVVTFRHVIGREFVIELLEGDGERTTSVVDHYGPIGGAAAVPTTAGDYSLAVTNYGGYWKIEIAQPRTPAAAIHSPPVEASGTGPDVVGTVDIDGSATIGATHDGESDFKLLCYDENATGAADAAVVFDEVGEFEGETTVQFDATAWIGVESDGAWAFEIR